jgi:hypothetical protein
MIQTRHLRAFTVLGALTLPTLFAQANDTCVETFYIGTNSGSIGGAVYFDVTATEPVTVSALRTNCAAAAGAAVTLDVYTISGTAAGNETNMAAWTLAASGSSTTTGVDTPTQFFLSTAVAFPTGITGIALVLTGSAHRYTDGTGGNEIHSSADGVLTVTGISATNVPFTGAPFAPRVWNGDFCYNAGSANCARTLFDQNNSGSPGGAVYFDLTATSPVTFSGLQTNYSVAIGTAVGVQVYATNGSAAANATNAGLWSLVAVDNGAALAAGVDLPTDITFAQPFSLPAGTFGIALVAVGTAHSYTDGTGMNQVHTSVDGVISISAGLATNVPFTAPTFQTRVWNGTLCHAPEDNCVETIFASNNGGAADGAVYFDIIAAHAVTISSLTTNTSETGGLFGMEVWTRAGTFAGFEANPGAWNLATIGDGNAVGGFEDEQSLVTFVAPLNLPAGRTGIALLMIGASHEYTNGMSNFTGGDGVLRVETGSASNTPFAGTIANRTWNGRLCYDGAFIGVDFCEPAVPNSTFRSGEIGVVGSTSVAANNVRLIARNLPNGSSGFFLTSQTAVAVPMAGGSQGTMCIAGGPIGRYVGPGQVKNSGLLGSFFLDIDLTQHPTPTGFISVLPGQSWNFQCWYRDANPGPVSNFTNAHSVTFN